MKPRRTASWLESRCPVMRFERLDYLRAGLIRRQGLRPCLRRERTQRKDLAAGAHGSTGWLRVTHLLLAPLTGECLGRRPGEARPRPAGEPAAVAFQPRGLVEGEHNDDLFGKHRCLDLAPQPAERERCDRRSQLGMRADIATPLVEGHRDVEPSILAHDAPIARFMAQRLTDSLGKSFIVENKPGAGGNLGTEQAVRAAGDGY